LRSCIVMSLFVTWLMICNQMISNYFHYTIGELINFAFFLDIFHIHEYDCAINILFKQRYPFLCLINMGEIAAGPQC
jgi:hypothetical protein